MPKYPRKNKLRFVPVVATSNPSMEQDQLTKIISDLRLAMMGLPFYWYPFSGQYDRFDISTTQEVIHSLGHSECASLFGDEELLGRAYDQVCLSIRQPRMVACLLEGAVYSSHHIETVSM